ncbi:MAG: histidine triad nucleotide-binding protein [Patescibacteria group bacterium]
MMECIFCKIAQKETPSDISYEDERFVVFSDIRPKAPLHLLITPKKHIPTLLETKEEHKELLGEMILLARTIAQVKKVNGFKLQMNVGKEGGQEIDHLHLHFLAQSRG